MFGPPLGTHHGILIGPRVGILGVAPLVREQGVSVPRLEARGDQDGDLYLSAS